MKEFVSSAFLIELDSARAAVPHANKFERGWDAGYTAALQTHGIISRLERMYVRNIRNARMRGVSA